MEVNSPMDEPPLVGDEELCFIAEIPFEGDFVPEDNIFSLKQQVVNSFDPNDKTCLQGNTMHPDMIGSYVDYLIRFENVGTANAVNIVIKDKINPVIFDISTLYITDASHQPMETEIKGNSVEFIFKDIQLPFDDANNDGFVAFKIKTHDHLSLGDTLSNKAEIYFDFNYPIITNDANTVFQVKVSNNDLDPLEEKLSVYPNPTRNNLSVEVESTIEQLSLFDIAGKMHLTWKDVQSQKFKQALNISPGVYVLQITTSTGHYFKKIVVQKE
jgi:hypothetical protein